MKLQSRSARCSFPIARSDRSEGHLVPGEESASFLLWAWPRLLGWPRTINWLFSPVVGNSTYPGDLWGIDSRGELLIVETKLDRTGRPQNPFADFVPYCSSEGVHGLWTAASLDAHWCPLLRGEETFIREHSGELDPTVPLSGTYRGVLPSRHRDTLWRWQALYRERILPKFASGQYRRAVERSLRNRLWRNNPPTFVGVIASVAQTTPRLSSRGRLALQQLMSAVGPRRVLLRAFRVEPDYSRGIRVESWTVPNSPANIRLQPAAAGAIISRRG